MNKKCCITFTVLILVLIMSGCGKKLMLSATQQNDSQQAIYMQAVHYEDGRITVRICNQSDYTMIYGNEYWLCKLENDEWVTVKSKKEYAWDEIAHELQSGCYVEVSYDLSVFGKLKAGTYRLMKNDLAAEFTLEVENK